MPPASLVAGKRPAPNSRGLPRMDPERAIESTRGCISFALGFQPARIFEQIFARLRRF